MSKAKPILISRDGCDISGQSITNSHKSVDISCTFTVCDSIFQKCKNQDGNGGAINAHHTDLEI